MAPTLNRPAVIYVGKGERVCINCIHYDQYYRHIQLGEFTTIPSSGGFCQLHKKDRKPLCQPCKDFEQPEKGITT